MKKFLIFILACTISSPLISPISSVKAAELKPQSIQSIAQKNDNFSNYITNGINKNKKLKELVKNPIISNNKITFTNGKTGKLTKIVYNENKTKATIYESRQASTLVKDDNGNIYLNGKLLIEVIKSNNHKNNGITLDENEYVTTYRTQSSYASNSATIAMGIMGLIGGPFGTALDIAGIAYGFMSYSQTNVYIEIDQFYETSTHTITDYCYYYKNSDYTGYLGSDWFSYVLEY